MRSLSSDTDTAHGLNKARRHAGDLRKVKVANADGFLSQVYDYGVTLSPSYAQKTWCGFRLTFLRLRRWVDCLTTCHASG